MINFFNGQILKTCPRYYDYNGDGLRTSQTLGKFITSYRWDVAAGLPVVLQETTQQLWCVKPAPSKPCRNVPRDVTDKTTYVYGLDLISATPEAGYSPAVTLAANIDALTTSVPYSSRGDPVIVNDAIVIDAERMKVSAVDTVNNVLTVVRGVDGSTPASHTAGADILASGNQRYYFADGLGSTVLTIAGQSPNVQAPTYRYDVFGALRSGSASGEPFLFTGEQYDARARGSNLNNGLYYLRARYYDPAIGRFLTRDPLPGTALAPQTLNRYAYVENNPVNRVDPSGMLTESTFLDVRQSAQCTAAVTHLLELLAFLGFGATALSMGGVAILAAPPPVQVFTAVFVATLIVYFSWEVSEQCGHQQ